jgi:molybdopterin-guanine dinucleotide biosynthesis protein A
MPWVEARHVRALVDALGDNDVAYANGEHLVAAWNPSALSALEAVFAVGERAPRRAISHVRAVAVTLPAGKWSKDVDTPEDLEPG